MATAQQEYREAHRRVVDVKGPASHKPCAFCGIFAAEWAYDHQDPREIFCDGYLWSVNTAHYMPLCKRDHRAYDRAFRQKGKGALSAVREALTAAGMDQHPEEVRRSVELTCHTAWRARESAFRDGLIKDRTVRAVPLHVQKATLALMRTAYANGPSGVTPEYQRAAWEYWDATAAHSDKSGNKHVARSIERLADERYSGDQYS